MNSALGWIGEIMQWFGNLIPTWTLIRARWVGIKYLPGGQVKILKPGIHWYWPATTEVESLATARQVLDTSGQTLMTKDGQPVYVAGLVVYKITDAYKYQVQNFDADDGMDDIVQTAIRNTIVHKDLSNIQADRNSADEALTEEVSGVLADFGVTVEVARLTDFSKAHVVNVIGGGLVSINAT